MVVRKLVEEYNKLKLGAIVRAPSRPNSTQHFRTPKLVAGQQQVLKSPAQIQSAQAAAINLKEAYAQIKKGGGFKLM